MGCLTMMRFLTLSAGVAAATALAAGQARAATWLLDYTATDHGQPAEASVTVEISDALNAVGGHDVTGISGHVDGDAIAGLIANPGQPFPSYSTDGWFIYDNVVWPDGEPTLSNPGLLFKGVSGDEYNLFSDNASTYELYDARAGVGFVDHSVGVLAQPQLVREVTLDGGLAVPEPAAWALMILGFGGIGAVLRRRRLALA